MYFNFNTVAGLGIIILTSLGNLVHGSSTWTPALAHWHVGDTNNTCILLVGYFSFILPYELTNGQTSEAIVPIPGEALAEGTCANWVQSITLKWTSPINPTENTTEDITVSENPENQAIFRFQQHGGVNSLLEGYFELSDIDAIIYTNPVQFPEAAQPDKIYELHVSGLHTWSAPLELSYFCGTPDSIALNTGSFKTTGVQAQAFHVGPIGTNNMDFGPRSYCAGDVTWTIGHGFLFMALLFIISLGIAIFVTRKRRVTYEPLL